jgi:putative PIN family toxin of toxin-antitoxin system
MSAAINVVLDTNILVSALWSKRSNPAAIIALIPDELIIPYFSHAIFMEYINVLKRPKLNFSVDETKELLNIYKEYGKVIFPNKSNIFMTDESDRKFYDAAKACNGCLITGNIKH